MTTVDFSFFFLLFFCSRSWISSTTQMYTMNDCKGDSLTEQRIQSKITTVVLAIFFVSLLGVGMGQTAVYTLGIPYIDDNVASRESPLYFGKNTNSSSSSVSIIPRRRGDQTTGGAKQGSRKLCFRATRKSLCSGPRGPYQDLSLRLF